MAANDALFAPLALRDKVSRNRVWLAPMSVCYGDGDGYVTQATIEHYGRRARGGAGVVITENFAISEDGRQYPRQTAVWDDAFLPGLAALAADIKRHGALAIMQIVHAGRYAGPWDRYEERPRLAPSAVEFPLQPGRLVTPQEMCEADIEAVIVDFAAAARRAEQAGFDGIEIHGAQGFLISQFLSPRINQREDHWGKDRSRFALAVLAAVRAAVRTGFIVGWHLLSEELLPDGYQVSDAVALAQSLEAGGVDFIIPVAGTFEALQHPDNAGLLWRPAFQLEAARKIAEAVNIPVIANGALGSPEQAAAVIEEGPFAAIGLARPLLADPDWAAKVQGAIEMPIRECACNPPMCLRTQMTGVTCNAWPADAIARGYFGYNAESA